VIQVFLVLELFLYQKSQIENLFHCAAFWYKAGLFFCQELFCLVFQSVEDYPQHDLARMAYETDESVVLALLEVSFLWTVSILLAILWCREIF